MSNQQAGYVIVAHMSRGGYRWVAPAGRGARYCNRRADAKVYASKATAQADARALTSTMGRDVGGHEVHHAREPMRLYDERRHGPRM